jgi:hypothetical protein
MRNIIKFALMLATLLAIFSPIAVVGLNLWRSAPSEFEHYSEFMTTCEDMQISKADCQLDWAERVKRP